MTTPVPRHTPPSYRAAGWWRDRTILDDLRDGARRHPDKPAVVCYHVDGSPTETVTYAELLAHTGRFAAALRGLGIGAGDVVTLQLPNSWQFVALCLATFRLGAVVNPVIPIMRRREVAHMVALTGSPVYVAPTRLRDFSYADLAAEVARAVPTLRHRVLLDDPSTPAAGGDDPAVVDFADAFLRADLPTEIDHPEALPDDLAQIMFTSGTTGEPKGVMHTHNTLHALVRTESEALGLTGDDVVAMGSPLTHQAGFAYCFLMPLTLGATAVQLDAWQPDLMLRVIEERRVTFSMGAPTFLVDLIDAQRRAPRDLSALRSFACGSAPIAPVVAERAADVLGTRVYALWGMTENGTVTITRPDDPPDLATRSDGSPPPWMEVRIVDDAGVPVPAGRTGRLLVRGANQCLGYYRRPEVYASCVDADGWFDTGDLAHDDGHGGIRIAGRVKDVISRGGEKIPVVEVEAALLRHPAVRDVALIGYPDERLGERACAVLVADVPLTLADVRAHLDALDMARQYWPERIELVDALPRTPSGKVQKFVLTGRYAAGPPVVPPTADDTADATAAAGPAVAA
ncbi:AMP-binding protein [Polymorphospora rubra]|uniref:AMP-binding protein n=1 Tax=Polymorphospora rubra TaxID=338584 RepID=UPI0033D66870